MPFDPFFIAAGDFNGDGLPDLVVSSEAGLVSVLLGNGDGTLQPRRDFSVGSSNIPFGIVVGDFNEDGKVDVVAAIGSPGSQVAILLGNGDGSLQSATFEDVGPAEPFALGTGDLNLDGKLDLIVTAARSDVISVLLGNGDGSFQSATNYSTLGGPQGITVADFNDDGLLDLAISCSEGTSSLFGNGDGSFGAAVNYVLPSGATLGIAAYDSNGDNIVDLGVAAVGTLVFNFLGNGTGGFDLPRFFPSGGKNVNLAVADVNGDGMLDLITVDGAGESVLVLPQVTAVLSRTNLAFGAVALGSSATASITLTNIASGTLTIGKIKIGGPSSQAFTMKTSCGDSLEAGASCRIQVSFTPSALGASNAFLKIQDSVSAVPQTVVLKGTGVN